MHNGFKNLNISCGKLISVSQVFVGAGNQLDNFHFSSSAVQFLHSSRDLSHPHCHSLLDGWCVAPSILSSSSSFP
jgi:hypothetical protein